VKILGISGSLRRSSYNTSLLGAAAGLLTDEVEFELWGGLKEVPPTMKTTTRRGRRPLSRPSARR
jgi:NAD(P)H-dependent FMN reductase